MPDTLKPCRCGTRPCFYQDKFGVWRAVCPGCGDEERHHNKQEAIDAWNRRVGEGEKG